MLSEAILNALDETIRRLITEVGRRSDGDLVADSESANSYVDAITKLVTLRKENS